MAPDGICRICGVLGKLSFEHVPPEAAFNDRPILKFAFEKFLAEPGTMDELDQLRGKQQQRGVGAHTLCERCNNLTGHWYGRAYAGWAHQAMRYLIMTRGGGTSLRLPYNLFPLRVLKQIVCMFFSVNGPKFQLHQRGLAKFVLDRDSQEFPPHVRIYAFSTLSNRSRAIGVAGLVHGLGTPSSRVHVFSEVTFPPFGFVITFGDMPPPERGFCEISDFARFRYQDWRAGVTMRLPLMPIYTPFPGDYRTQLQTYTDYRENLRIEQDLRRAGGAGAGR